MIPRRHRPRRHRPRRPGPATRPRGPRSGPADSGPADTGLAGIGRFCAGRADPTRAKCPTALLEHSHADPGRRVPGGGLIGVVVGGHAPGGWRARPRRTGGGDHSTGARHRGLDGRPETGDANGPDIELGHDDARCDSPVRKGQRDRPSILGKPTRAGGSRAASSRCWTGASGRLHRRPRVGRARSGPQPAACPIGRGGAARQSVAVDVRIHRDRPRRGRACGAQYVGSEPSDQPAGGCDLSGWLRRLIGGVPEQFGRAGWSRGKVFAVPGTVARCTDASPSV